ncbi:MAG TPA: DUF4124 domain-containing protein [Steroidobacteraceae bacterium]|jgi:hypothetical protein|nr:DUF4124 domain-containing protein [Steroidobacteraceae bacterium]
MFKRIAWGLMLTCLSMAASADVFRWVDADGRVHYSDRPDSEKAVRVGIVSHATDPDAIAARAQSEADDRAKAANQQAQQQAQQNTSTAVQKDVEKSREGQCKEAKEHYRIAIESQKLYRVGKNGEREYLTSQEIDAARLNARKDMDTVCGQASGS